MKKIKILAVSDWYKLHTGFACVLRNIVKRIKKLDPNIEWHHLAWYYNKNAESHYPDIIDKDKVYPTEGTNEDRYAAKTFPKLIHDKTYDIVWGTGDHWMLQTLAENHILNRYKLIMYSPVDSQPLPLSSLPVFSEADVLVMYTYWGQQIIKHQFPFLKTTVIHHGVDTEVFHPLSYEHKMNIRRQMNISPDTFIVGNFNRNQPRKNIPEMLQAFRLFLNPWSSCPKCKETFFVPLNECPNCGGKVYTGPGKTKKETVLFLHMLLNAPPEQGWNISEKVYGGKPGGLIERYNLRGYILHTEGINIGMGVSDEKLNELYNFVDLNLNVSAAEGFGLTSLEAIAAGNAPSLVSNYGGHLDFIDNIGRTVNSFYYRPQPISNVEWCVPDIVDFTKKLDLFYYNDPDIIRKKYNIEKKKDFLCGKELRNYYTTEGRQKIIKEYNWDVIAQQWLKLFRSVKLDKLNSKKPVQLEQI